MKPRDRKAWKIALIDAEMNGLTGKELESYINAAMELHKHGNTENLVNLSLEHVELVKEHIEIPEQEELFINETLESDNHEDSEILELEEMEIKEDVKKTGPGRKKKV